MKKGNRRSVVKRNAGPRGDELDEAWRRAEQDDAKELSELLKQGVDVDASNDRLESACCNARSVGLVRFLIEQGLDPNESSDGDLTALHYCGVSNFDEGVRLLLAHGASVDVRTPEGVTPLHIAARHAAPKAMAALLDGGADPHSTDNKGHNAMSELIGDKDAYALRPSTLESARLLRDHGVEVDAHQARMIATLQRAADRKRKQIARFAWSKLEDRIVRLFRQATISFAELHKGEVFCGFCLDCDMQEGGQILLGLNTAEHLASKRGSASEDQNYRWSPGDWAYCGLAATTGNLAWSKAMRPLLIDGSIDSDIAERMMESACRAALRIVDDGVLDSLARGKEFVVLVIDHHEDSERARARMARIIASSHSCRQDG